MVKAWFLPPIRRGDLDKIKDPALVGIIDGVLDDGFRIQSDEIAAAAGRGLRFFGAGSTGALLAATQQEVHVVGFGKVYSFLSHHPDLGTLIELLYSEPDYQAFTLPLINVVLGIQQRTPERSLAVAERLGRLPLQERTRENIRKLLCGCGIPDANEMLEFNFKQSDAVMLLKMFHSLQRQMKAW